MRLTYNNWTRAIGWVLMVAACLLFWSWLVGVL